MTRIVSNRYGISLPDPALRDEPPDVPADLKRLLDGLERSAMYSQGVVATRPVSTGGTPGIQGRLYFATDENVLYYDYGTGWYEVAIPRDGGLEGSKIAWHDGGTPPTGTGDQGVWSFRVDTNGRLWLMKWNAGATLYKWEFMGGSPLFSEIAGNEPFGDSATYANATTPGPDITVPRTGQYEIEFGITGLTTLATHGIGVAPKFGTAATSDADACFFGPYLGFGSPTRKIIRTLTAADVIRLQYKRINASGGTPTVEKRWISLRPIRFL